MTEIKAMCNHCFEFGTVYEISKYYLCKEHKDLKQYQSKKIKKPKRIKPISDKRKVENEHYNEVRTKYLKNNPNGECGCESLATEIHHKAGRTGSFLTDDNTFMAITRPCHRLIHDDHSHALKNGFIWTQQQINEYLNSKK